MVLFCCPGGSAPQALPAAGSGQKDLAAGKDELDKNILAPPSTAQLAAFAQMNNSKLQHSFKRWYGVSSAEYIREGKMKYASANHLGYRYTFFHPGVGLSIQL